MAPSFTAALSSRDLTLASAGGKAAALGRMVRAGLPVPPGFVVTTDAYRAFVGANGLSAPIAAAWTAAAPSGTGPGDSSSAADAAERIESATAALRARFVAGRIPGEVELAVREALASLSGEGREVAVAVRSSATAEDLPEASFAGQQDTYLNVRGADAVIDAVRRCWASLWTARAVAYRARQGIAPDAVALAVVVQKMAPATAAGVMFTLHPVTGREDRVVINAAWGLGEALVSGRTNPDTVVVDKASGAVLRVDLGDKRVMTATTATGTEEAEVPADRRDMRALDDAAAAGLATLATELEALFGGPQDVEWAIVDGKPVLLQSRPITTRPPAVPGDDAWPPVERGEVWPFDLWTQQDMGERWPEPPTPLTWSVSEPMNEDILQGMVATLSAPWAGRVRWSRRAYGRVYMNEGALLHTFTHGYGMPLSMVMSGLTHPAAAPKGADGWQLGKVLRQLPYFWAAATKWEKNVDAFEADFPKIDDWVDTFVAGDRSAAEDAALIAEAREVWFPRLMTYVAKHTSATSLSMSAWEQLRGFVLARGGDEDTAHALGGGIQGVIAAEMVPAMAALAEPLRAAGLAEIALTMPPGEALAALRAEPRAAPFFAALAPFLRRHGHRCLVEAELRVPRWVEAPETLLAQLAPYLSGAARAPSESEPDRTARSSAAFERATLVASGERSGRAGSAAEPDPDAKRASDAEKSRAEPGGDARVGEAAKRREAATAELNARLGWLDRKMFASYLARSHRFTRMRDNGQGYVVKLLLPIRTLHAELGRRWAARGWLREADDVWFLVNDDLDAVLRGGSPAGLQAKADARRVAHAHWLTQPAPEVLDAHLEPVPPAPMPGADANTLVGVGASRGTITGVARVVATPAEAAKLQPGDILVTRATDPGWTPVFSLIGGAVLEVGGLLSHGAIVAREYGLPAVVAAAGCTQRIRDGQRITVDGTTGKVHLAVG